MDGHHPMLSQKGGHLAKAPLDKGQPAGMRGPQGRAKGKCGRIAVNGKDLGHAGLKQGAGIATGAKSAIHIDAIGPGRQRRQNLVQQDRTVGRRRLGHGCPPPCEPPPCGPPPVVPPVEDGQCRRSRWERARLRASASAIFQAAGSQI